MRGIKAIRIVSAIMALSLIIISFIIDNVQMVYYTQLFVVVILLIYSISELKNNRKARATFLVFLAVSTALVGLLSLSS
ncbi:hypothetical protein EQV77_14510 [Halobacillus fulvus]|nr:hypothetical protein EQV77_14510 [Halobacillus fulvus]